MSPGCCTLCWVQGNMFAVLHAQGMSDDDDEDGQPAVRLPLLGIQSDRV